RAGRRARLLPEDRLQLPDPGRVLQGRGLQRREQAPVRALRGAHPLERRAARGHGDVRPGLTEKDAAGPGNVTRPSPTVHNVQPPSGGERRTLVNNNRSLVVPAALMAFAAVACGGGGTNADGDRAAGGGSLVKVQGAGASFPAPLYSKWFKTYSSAHQGVQIDYQSVGSGSGVKAVIDKTVDFGASDAAMSPDEIAQVQGG